MAHRFDNNKKNMYQNKPNLYFINIHATFHLLMFDGATPTYPRGRVIICKESTQLEIRIVFVAVFFFFAWP